MTMLAGLREAAAGLLNLLLPPCCALCNQLLPPGPATVFCPTCQRRIPPLEPPFCSRCALPFATAGGANHLCADCLRETVPRFQRTLAAGRYAGQLRTAVQRFKYAGEVDLDRPLGTLLALRLAEQCPPDGGWDLLVPVPLHRRRLQARTYNQSLLLARVLGRALQLPVAAGLLQRTRPTPPQQGLPAEVRRRNLRGAFALAPSQSAGGRILLVDDVMTTGSTVRECARVLQEGGARQIEVAVLARAGRLYQLGGGPQS